MRHPAVAAHRIRSDGQIRIGEQRLQELHDAGGFHVGDVLRSFGAFADHLAELEACSIQVDELLGEYSLWWR